jgi:hypothetical protein
LASREACRCAIGGFLDETAQHARETIGDQVQDLDRRAFSDRDNRESDSGRLIGPDSSQSRTIVVTMRGRLC